MDPIGGRRWEVGGRGRWGFGNASVAFVARQIPYVRRNRERTTLRLSEDRCRNPDLRPPASDPRPPLAGDDRQWATPRVVRPDADDGVGQGVDETRVGIHRGGA